jgi:hypothetical protein
MKATEETNNDVKLNTVDVSGGFAFALLPYPMVDPAAVLSR